MVVDGWSIDSTLKIVNRYGSKKARLIYEPDRHFEQGHNLHAEGTKRISTDQLEESRCRIKILFMGIISEYLVRVYMETRKNPFYILRDK